MDGSSTVNTTVSTAVSIIPCSSVTLATAGTVLTDTLQHAPLRCCVAYS
jgi:hypothetical protein